VYYRYSKEFSFSVVLWALKASHKVKLGNFQSTIPMDLLRFSRSWRNAGQESATEDVEELKQANVDETTDGLYFDEYCFDEDIIVHAVIDLFHRAFQKGCQLGCLKIYYCTGRVDEILQAASSLDIFDEIEIFGDSNLSHRGFWSISSAMKFNKRLTKLELSEMEMTRQQAAALGAGLITFNSQNHFKELHMRHITFADGAITELASGLRQNSSLCILNVDDCNLGAAEAELVGAVESHPSLKELSLWGNKGHALVVALGKVLASRSCRLEVLDFSYQGTNDNGLDGLTGHIGILAQGLGWNESLKRLDLSSNGLLDKDMDHLGQILATCKLEQLDLENNRTTHSGFLSLTQNITKSLKRLDFSGNDFDREEAACHSLTLFKEHPQLWEDGFDWEDSESPIQQKIQHFKDLNRCGRILLAHDGGAIPLSVWPIVLARANTVLQGCSYDPVHERTPNVIFHLLQGPALMQRRF
jgi:Ran GTPase-activating protein (RanGAP) involved in mRNA processing and transport